MLASDNTTTIENWTCQWLLIFFVGGLGGPNKFQKLFKKHSSLKLTHADPWQIHADHVLRSWHTTICLVSCKSCCALFLDSTWVHGKSTRTSKTCRQFMTYLTILCYPSTTQALFRLKGNLLQCFSIGWTVMREREYAMWQQWLSETWNSCEYNGSKVVSTHLWNTPLNLYQQAVKGFLS